MCRSLKILYAKGLLSKKKHKSVCVNLSSTGSSVQTVKLVYYDKLIDFIKSVDIANIHDFTDNYLCMCLHQRKCIYLLIRNQDLNNFLSIWAVLHTILEQPLVLTGPHLGRMMRRQHGFCLSKMSENIFKVRMIIFYCVGLITRKVILA